jgi:hypothetical protein
MAGISTRPRIAAVAFAVFSACLAVALLSADTGVAGSAKVNATPIGHTTSTPKPNCPTPSGPNPPANEACQAMARVTGFQVDADGRHNPFKVRKPGMIVAWSINLSEPTKSEQEFFANAITNSGPPSARLAVIKPKGEGTYKLIRQSPIVPLQSTLGSKPLFTLTNPLKVKKGMFVALTTSTWVSNLADKGASADDRWRTSRDPGKCGTEPNDTPADNEADLKKLSRPQQKVGNKRAYACEYSSARILYWAYYVPN